MSTPKDAPYKLKQKKPHMVKLLQCAICQNGNMVVSAPLESVTVDTPAGPKKFMVHGDCLRRERR